jgi:aspartate/methionine/tyrosine aminotransferase
VYLEYTDDPVSGSLQGLGDHVAVASSFTKAYGLGTVRFGWLMASPERIAAALRYNDYISVLYPNPCAWVGLSALDRLPVLSERARRIQARGRAVVQAWIDARDDVSWVAPDAGVIGFVRLAGVSDTAAFVERLAAEQDTLVVPGEFFGAPGFVRLGFGGDEAALREGLRRIGEALGG